MNLFQPLRSASRLLHSLFLKCRLYLPKQRCFAFKDISDPLPLGIGPVFVINLDRQEDRWADMVRELDRILDASGRPLSHRIVRYPAVDAQADPPELRNGAMVDPFYTLGEQLFVEPQPQAMPDRFDLERSIRMSDAEIAVACSHIGVWKAIAQSNAAFALVLEDDVWFDRDFGSVLQQAWCEMHDADQDAEKFDILYVSYKEVRHGAPKELLSKNVFRPERGLWFMSGYVLSKAGAQALLDLLPCRGPIDLWINHKFLDLKVRALRRSVVDQRRDLDSTNSYSILPALSRIGIIESGDAALFHRGELHTPVFAFGIPGSGLSSLAMALSMLGYRCCSDLETIPESEFERLLEGHADRIFDAYVNIGSLAPKLSLLRHRYPNAKYIVIEDDASPTDDCERSIRGELEGSDVIYLRRGNVNWRRLCEHLKLAPPGARYPEVQDIGQRPRVQDSKAAHHTGQRQLHDPSPWVVASRLDWPGISIGRYEGGGASTGARMCFDDDLTLIDPTRWLLRNDTFPGNLGLFRPANVTPAVGGGVSLKVYEEPLGVRNLSAAAISSHRSFLFGRFEATLQATNVPGLVTGFFLHRDSPRQEIDVEIPGNRPDHLLVNVFYNPGGQGAKFDYGYRGAPTLIKLGFDASKAPHQFAIEWDPGEIRWLVDQKLVHRRVVWDPTPIPHLPMTLHVNTWPTRSRELAGRLALRVLPASALVRKISVDSFSTAI